MTEQEIIEAINYRTLNEKCNHLIFTGLKEAEVVTITSQIKPKSLIMNYEKVNFGFSYVKCMKWLSNVFIDLEKIDVTSLLNVVLEYLNIKERVSFIDRKSLMTFREILRKYEQGIQLITIQNHTLNELEQRRFNELFSFKSYFFSLTCFIEENNLSTYQTLHGEMLEDRKNYQKIYIDRI